MVAEEDSATFRSGGDKLVARVVDIVNSAYPKSAARLDAAAGAKGGAIDEDLERLLSGADYWTPDDIATAIASGEFGRVATPSDDYFVLDPIDGTKGFLRGAKEPGKGHQYCIGLAYVSQGVPVLGVLGCPSLPFPSLAAPECEGTLISAQAGCGTFQEPLPADDAADPSAATTLAAAAVRANSEAVEPSGAILCESYEAGHSDHGLSSRIASHMGISNAAKPVRLDSMCKYALLARGDGHVYLRFPRPGYIECAWDHAAGSVVLQEAGGVVTDALGRPLDFTKGAKLSGNDGVVASASPSLHATVLAAVAAERAT